MFVSSLCSAGSDLKALLDSLQLSSIHDKLIDECVTTVDDLRDISENEMINDLGMKKFAARKLYKYLHKDSGSSSNESQSGSVFRMNIVDPKLKRTDADIKTAVNDWCRDPTVAEEKYGHISNLDTSVVN